MNDVIYLRQRPCTSVDDVVEETCAEMSDITQAVPIDPVFSIVELG